MTFIEIVKKYGKNDGHDFDRYIYASELAQRIDSPVFVCFESLINLENKGFIELVNCNTEEGNSYESIK
jgi:hypothetical protein